MTTNTEAQTAKPKQVPDFYIFESADGQNGSKPAGAAFVRKNGKGFTPLAGGERYTAFPPKAKAGAEVDRFRSSLTYCRTHPGSRRTPV